MNLISMYHAMNDDVTMDVLRRVGRDYNYTTIFISDNLYLHNILIEHPDSCLMPRCLRTKSGDEENYSIC